MPGQTVDPETFRVAIKKLLQRVRKCNTATISLEEVLTLAKSVVNLWFNDVAPFAKFGSDNLDALQVIDSAMNQLLAHTLKAARRESYLATLNEALRAYEKGVYVYLHKTHGAVLAGMLSTGLGGDDVTDALAKISESLSVGYQQVRKDLSDSSRISWRGTANELREVIRELLEILAPDSLVTKAKWYKQDQHTKGATQAQRARFALEQRATQEHRTSAVQETLNLVEESIARLIRKTYQRANSVVHSPQDRDEVKRILGYFDLLARDLLGLS
jgi:exonuclease VII small subunit